MLKISQKLTFLFLWLTIFTIPWQKSILIPSIGSINKFIGITLAMSAMLSIIMQKKIKKLPLFYYMFFIFIILSMITYFISPDSIKNLEKNLLFLQLIFLTWCIYEFASDETDVNRLLKAFLFGSFIITIQLIYMQISGAQQISSARSTLEGYNPNQLGILISLSILIAIFLALKNNKFYFTFLPLAIYAVFLTGSRTSLILLLFVAISTVWLFFKFRIRYRKLMTISISIIILLMMYIVPEEQINRLATIDEELSSGTLNGRTDIWKAGIVTFIHNPIIGVGAGQFLDEVDKNSTKKYGAAAHNSYLSILVEYGLIGFIVFYSMIFLLVVYALKVEDKYVRWLFVSIMLFWLILSISSHSEVQKYTWVIFGLVITSFCLNKKTTKV